MTDVSVVTHPTDGITFRSIQALLWLHHGERVRSSSYMSVVNDLRRSGWQRGQQSYRLWLAPPRPFRRDDRRKLDHRRKWAKSLAKRGSSGSNS